MINTIYPNVVPLSDLFEAFEMSKSVIIPGKGSRTLHSDKFCFVGGPHAIKHAKVTDPDCCIRGYTFFRYGKPKQEVLDKTRAYCLGGNVCAFRLTQQGKSDIFLLTATDRTSIPSIPVAWIHRDSIPDTPLPTGVTA